VDSLSPPSTPERRTSALTRASSTTVFSNPFPRNSNPQGAFESLAILQDLFWIKSCDGHPDGWHWLADPVELANPPLVKRAPLFLDIEIESTWVPLGHLVFKRADDSEVLYRPFGAIQPVRFGPSEQLHFKALSPDEPLTDCILYCYARTDVIRPPRPVLPLPRLTVRVFTQDLLAGRNGEWRLPLEQTLPWGVTNAELAVCA
jgi:hypothetical protein